MALEETLAAQPAPIAKVAARLQTVPGVGPLTALTAVAVFSDVHRFPSAKHAASYAGLVPATHQSGDRDTHGHITKRGSAALRTMLCEAAHHAQRPTHPLHPYFARRCAQRGYKMAVVAVAHRLCRMLFALLRDGVAFDVRQARRRGGTVPAHERAALPAQAPAGEPPRVGEGASRPTRREPTRHAS